MSITNVGKNWCRIVCDECMSPGPLHGSETAAAFNAERDAFTTRVRGTQEAPRHVCRSCLERELAVSPEARASLEAVRYRRARASVEAATAALELAKRAVETARATWLGAMRPLTDEQRERVAAAAGLGGEAL